MSRSPRARDPSGARRGELARTRTAGARRRNQPSRSEVRQPLDIKDLLVHRVEELFNVREHADVVLTAPSDGREFFLHRGIVAGWSAVLRRLFEDEFTATTSGGGHGMVDLTHVQRIELPFEGSSSALDEMLRFCYTGYIELESAAQAMEVLAAATVYELHELALICEKVLNPKLGPGEVKRLLQREKERITGMSAAANGGKLGLPKRDDQLEALRVQQITRSQDPRSQVVGHLDRKERVDVEQAVVIGDRGSDLQWRIKCKRGWVGMFEPESERAATARDYGGEMLDFQGEHVYRRYALVPYGASGHTGHGGKRTVLTQPSLSLQKQKFDAVRVHRSTKLQEVVADMFYVTTAPVTGLAGLPYTATQDSSAGTLRFKRGDTIVVTDRTKRLWEGTVNDPQRGQVSGTFPGNIPGQHSSLDLVEMDMRFTVKQSQSDVTLVLVNDQGDAEPTKFLAHRAVLAMWSETFEEEFGDDMVDTRRKSDHTFHMRLEHYGHPEEMEKMLKFMYTGELAVTAADAPTFLKLAMIYGVNELLSRHCQRVLQDTGNERTIEEVRKKTVELRISHATSHVQRIRADAEGGGDGDGGVEIVRERRENRRLEVPFERALLEVKEHHGVVEGSVITRKILEKLVHALYPDLSLRREVDLACAAIDPSAGIALRAEQMHIALKYMMYFRYMRPVFREIEKHIPDGRLSVGEFETACHHLGEVMTRAEVEEQFDELDEEHHDVIEFDAFCEWACRRNAHPPEIGESSGLTKQHLLMPSQERRTEKLREAGVSTDAAVLTDRAAKEATELLFPGHNLSAECISSYRALQVASSRPYQMVLDDSHEEDIERELVLLGMEGESPFYALPGQEVLAAQFRQFLEYVIWLHDHWPKLQIVLQQIPDQHDRTMNESEFSCACMLMNIHLDDESHLRSEFEKLERKAPYERGYARADDFVSWMVLRQPFPEGPDLSELTLEEVSLRSPREQRHPHIMQPRLGGEHALQCPSKDEVTVLFERYDPNGHGMTKTDVSQALREVFPRINVISHTAVSRAFDAADGSGDGWISASEFQWLMKYFVFFYREDAKFEAIRRDVKPSGKISRDGSTAYVIPDKCRTSGKTSECTCKDTRRLARCIRPFKSKNPTDLELRVGDIVVLTSAKPRPRDSLWKGYIEENTSKKGSFPYYVDSSEQYVEEIRTPPSCALFWILAERMDISIEGAKVSSAYKTASGKELVDGTVEQSTKLTFPQFCTWVVRTKCGPSFAKEVKANRQDVHFMIDTDEAHKRTGKMKSATVFETPVPQELERIWEEVAYTGGATLGAEELVRAVQMAWPDFKDTGLSLARAMTAVGVDEYGHIPHSQFRELLVHLNFFSVKGHALDDVDRTRRGRMNLAGFEKAVRDLHFQMTIEQMHHTFEKLVTTREEHASDVSMKHAKNRTYRRDQSMVEYKDVQRLSLDVAYEDFCTWAAKEHSRNHALGREGPDMKIPTFSKAYEIFTAQAGEVGFLTLAGVTKCVEKVWPELDVHRSIILRAYKACMVHGGGKVHGAEFHMCLQYISYLEFAWEVLEGLALTRDRRMVVDEMIVACESLSEWLDPDEIYDIFQELADPSGSGRSAPTIGFDQFCSWLLSRHVKPPQAEELEEPPTTPSQLQEAVPPVVVIELPGQSERARWFDEWDDDGNGFLSLEEIQGAIYPKFPGLSVTVIKRAYKTADVSASSFVGRQEFGRFWQYLEFFNTNWSKFEQIADNVQHSGRLTLSEFKRAAAKLGLYLESNAAGATASGGKAFAGKSASNADAPDAAMEFQTMRSFSKERILMVEFCTWVARKRCPADDEWMDTTKYAHMKPKQVYKLGIMYKNGDGVEKDLAEAHICFKSAAHRGSVSARRELAECYLQGKGVTKDVTHGMQCLAQAAREGDDTALCRLGLAYMKGDGVPKDYRQAYRNFLAGANRHNAKCQFNLGLCYANGDGVLRCGMMAAQCYQQAAHQELPEAQNNLGECYMTGNGVQQNKDKGMWWKKQASDRGLAEAQYSIGLVYLHGHIGVEKNVAVAMKYLKLAEKQKHPKAIAIISQIKKQEQHKQKELNYERSLDDFFEEDRITPKLTLSDENRKQAFDHVRDAAAEGVIDAQWHFAKLIDEGVIHKKAGKADIKRAAAEYTKAAKGKHTESLNRLGEILLTIGWDEHQLDKHWAEAIRNFTLAANAGHVEAMYNLGEAWMARGFSGEDDDPELFPVNHAAVDKAVGWFVKAAEHGHQASQYNLGVLYQDGLRAERRVFEGDQVDGGNAVVEVSSRITFDADYDSILSSDFARSEFEAEFRLSMAAALGDGRSIRSEQVLIQDIHHGSIIVEFWLEVPPEEAERVVGLVNELRQRDAAVALHVGRRRLAANTATISKPFKRAGPVLVLMNEIKVDGGNAVVVSKNFQRAVYYYRLAARNPGAMQAKVDLAWLLLREGEGAHAAGTVSDHSTNDTAMEAYELMQEASETGHQHTDLILEQWDDVCEAVRGEGSVITRMETLHSSCTTRGSNRVYRMVLAVMVKDIDHQEDLDLNFKLKGDLDQARDKQDKAKAKVVGLKEKRDFLEARNGRLLMVSSRTLQAHRLAKAGEVQSTCVEFEWAATGEVTVDNSMDQLLKDARNAMSSENVTGRYTCAALWTFPRPAVDGKAAGFAVTEGNRVTLAKVKGDEKTRRFWRDLAEMIDDDGYIVLFGLGSGDDSDEWHDMLTELSTLMRRGIVVPDINPKHDVMDDGTLSIEATSNHDFRDFFAGTDGALKLSQAWAKSVAPELAKERETMAPFEERAAQAQRDIRSLKDKESEAKAKHRRLLEKEERADYRVEAEIKRDERRRERGATISPRGPSGSQRFVPRQVQELREVQEFLHESDVGEVQLMIGIDFAGSNDWNGHKTFGGRSLHAVDAGVPTPYEAAIRAICKTMAVFDDDDNTIPCYGFGDHRSTGDSDDDAKAAAKPSVFSLQPDDTPCNGRDSDDVADDIADSYQRAVRSGLQLGKPKIDKRTFAPIVNKAVEIMNEKRDSPEFFDQLHVLVILTDGEVHRDEGLPATEWSLQELETVKAIQQASHLPLSIVVIGVGDGTGEHVSDDDGVMTEGGSWKCLHHMVRGIHGRQFENFGFAEYGQYAGADTSHTVKLAQLIAHAVRSLPEQWRVIRKMAISDPLGPHEKEFPRNLPTDRDSDSSSDDDSDDSDDEWDVDVSRTDKQYISQVKTRPPPPPLTKHSSPRSLRASVGMRGPTPEAMEEAKKAEIERQFDRLDLDSDGVLTEDELAQVTEVLPEFGGEVFSDWHFTQFCDLSDIDTEDSGLTKGDFVRYCSYMRSRPWAEIAFCVYDTDDKGSLTEAELCLLCRNELYAFQKTLGRRLPSVHWNADMWSRFWYDYAGIQPHDLVDGAPTCSWSVFSKFVHHMRHIARMTAHTRSLSYKKAKIKKRLKRGDSTGSVRDPHGEAQWEIQFDHDWETKLLARRRAIGPNPVPHPDYRHLHSLPQRDTGADSTDSDDDGDEDELHGMGGGAAAPFEPEPEPERPRRGGRSPARGDSSDEDDMM